MPEDVKARIVVAVESSAAKQRLNDVRQGIANISDERRKDLLIAKAKAANELAEYNSMTAAAKAYQAQLKLLRVEKTYNKFSAITGVDKDTMQRLGQRVADARAEYLKLASAESAANLQAFQAKETLNQLTNSTGKVTKATKAATNATNEYARRTIAARTASRLLHTNLGSGTATMLKAGIIAAGVAATIKLLAHAYTRLRDRYREANDLQKANTSSLNDAWQEQKANADRQRDALSSLERINQQYRISAQDGFTFIKAIETLGTRFERLGLKIDPVTGRLKNLGKAQARFEREQIEAEKKNINTQLKENSARMKLLKEQQDTAGFRLKVPFSNKELNLGGALGEKELQETQKELDSLSKRQYELRKRLHDLRRMNPEEDQKRKSKMRNLERSSRASGLPLRSSYNTSTDAIEANSVEAARLQSRVFRTSDPLKESAFTLKKILPAVNDIRKKVGTLPKQSAKKTQEESVLRISGKPQEAPRSLGGTWEMGVNIAKNIAPWADRLLDKVGAPKNSQWGLLGRLSHSRLNRISPILALLSLFVEDEQTNANNKKIRDVQKIPLRAGVIGNQIDWRSMARPWQRSIQEEIGLSILPKQKEGDVRRMFAESGIDLNAPGWEGFRDMVLSGTDRSGDSHQATKAVTSLLPEFKTILQQLITLQQTSSLALIGIKQNTQGFAGIGGTKRIGR